MGRTRPRRLGRYPLAVAGIAGDGRHCAPCRDSVPGRAGPLLAGKLRVEVNGSMLLAIDTSTSLASLALLDGFTVHASHQWNVGQRHSVEIFNALDQLLNPLGEDTVSDISAIAVATGPGSFNGTRVAVTVAKTLAFVWQVPLVGVPTLHGIAQAYVNSRDAVADGGVLNGTLLMAQHASVLALLEAGRDE